MSRRTVLRGAAGAGAVGLAAATGVGAVVAATRPETKAPAPAGRPAAAARPANTGPLVVYLRNASTGEFDLFAGASKVRFRDPALVAQLLQAVQ